MKRYTINEAELKARNRMTKYGIKQTEIADYLGVSPQAVNNQLKRGTIDRIMRAIDVLASEHYTQKVAS